MGERGAGPATSVLAVFPTLTEKQHEVLRFVAENRTSKEIARELGISESAVNQRIESVRSRTGSPPRAELARVYRQYLQDLENARDRVPGAIIGTFPGRGDAVDAQSLTDPAPVGAPAPWREPDGPRVVPEALDKGDAGPGRTFTSIVIVAGLVLLAVVGLGMTQGLTALL
ncbi:hypothetical protein GCM10011494_39110 [Novosphingobium endophyticum]|uniref:HTH luxR-type domain-containing protein n=1 Tax=Novosphingobium endophyticum TaxID=1955250 RepID=A0A916X7C6_9SPHN|nr:helix-turn-helix transcriptional regulator [Novosphingobium endophyticum]GGC16416.1 hypothetical protein GCM10011494_39110 [Novosphingobium endophyticum]